MVNTAWSSHDHTHSYKIISETEHYLLLHALVVEHPACIQLKLLFNWFPIPGTARPACCQYSVSTINQALEHLIICNSYNMAARDLPDIYMPKPEDAAYISDKSRMAMLQVICHLCALIVHERVLSSSRGVGHDQLHYEALPKIIILEVAVLPNDTDILYKDDYK